jgi:hypothetical protein
VSLPPFDAPVPAFVAGMDADGATLTVGLGLLVREAAALEYALHGLFANLKEAPKPFAFEAGESASTFIEGCRKRLGQVGDDVIPAHSRVAILHDLDLCSARLEERNRYVHGTWVYDDARQTWLTLRGRRKATRPEIELASAEEVWQLAAELGRLSMKLTAWDAEHFGVRGDPELGEPARVSVKRL